ncbi:MAG: PepSY domain-containing protein [Steroidobacter sp.]
MRAGPLIFLTTFALLCVVPTAAAQQLIDRRPPAQYYIEHQGMSLDQAVEMAQRRYRARAVKAETVSQGDRRVHKIRLLSPEGKVWNVLVDAQTGAMH